MDQELQVIKDLDKQMHSDIIRFNAIFGLINVLCKFNLHSGETKHIDALSKYWSYK